MTTPLWFASLADAGLDSIISEDDCLALIDAVFPARTVHLPFGRGDDCAELLCASSLALSTDFFWQDVHFRTAYFTPEEAGAKALTVAVSDLAAAGARPLGFSLGLMLPPGISRRAVQAVMQGMRNIATPHDLTLTGGDISLGEAVGFCITVWGESAVMCRDTASGSSLPSLADATEPHSPHVSIRDKSASFFLQRGQAREGDSIFLVGAVGLARAGLLLLERHGRAACERHPVVCAAHLRPQPLIQEGLTLARLAQEYAISEGSLGLMDCSDGLARDLPRLLGKPHSEGKDALGAEISLPAALFSSELLAAAEELGVNPHDMILAGGEDYALLGTCPLALWRMVQERVPQALHLGTVTARSGIFCNGAPLGVAGFDHFAAAPQGKAPPAEALPGKPPHMAAPQGGAPLDSTTCAISVAQPPCRGGEACHTSSPSISAVTRRAGMPLAAATLPLPLDLAGEITTICARAWQRGLLAGFNGNVSCRVDSSATGFSDYREACLITRSGAAKSMLTHADFALLSLPDGVLLAGASPSTEAEMHLAVYRQCLWAKAIIHCHPPHLLALSLRLSSERLLAVPLFEAETYRTKLGFVPDLLPGSAALACAVAEQAEHTPAVFMQRHGLTVCAESLPLALGLAEELEQLAGIQLAGIFSEGK